MKNKVMFITTLWVIIALAGNGTAFVENGNKTTETLGKADGTEYDRIAKRGTGISSADCDEEGYPVQDGSVKEYERDYRGGKNN